MFKFTSKTHVCLSVALKGGGNAHVSFTELTGKGSVFTTDDKRLAESLRQHHKFGKLFKEEEVKEEHPAADAKGGGENAAEVHDAAGKAEDALTFDNNEDAKDYLAEKYGISRSKMRTRAAIVEAAKGVGVQVSWKEAGSPAADATGTVAEATNGGEDVTEVQA